VRTTALCFVVARREWRLPGLIPTLFLKPTVYEPEFDSNSRRSVPKEFQNTCRSGGSAFVRGYPAPGGEALTRYDLDLSG
jgi:hypothetical protein